MSKVIKSFNSLIKFNIIEIDLEICLKLELSKI